MFLICNNAAQGILSSFFFKYAGIIPANKENTLVLVRYAIVMALYLKTWINLGLLCIPRKDYLGLAFILGVERLRFYWCVGQINLFVVHVLMAIQAGCGCSVCVGCKWTIFLFLIQRHAALLHVWGKQDSHAHEANKWVAFAYWLLPPYTSFSKWTVVIF